MPLFEFLLARNRIEDVVVTFKPNKKMNSMAGSESADRVGLVLMYSTDQIIGHANVEGAVLSTCQDVNVVHDRIAWNSGFRARATQVGLGRLGQLSLPISGKSEIGGPLRNDA